MGESVLKGKVCQPRLRNVVVGQLKARSGARPTMNYPKKPGSICTDRGHCVYITYSMKTWFLKILSVYKQKPLNFLVRDSCPICRIINRVEPKIILYICICPISYIGINQPPPLFQDLAPPLAVVISPKYRTYTYHT